MGNYDLAYKILHDVVLFMLPKDRMICILEQLVTLMTNYIYDYREFEHSEKQTALDEILIDQWQSVQPKEQYLDGPET